MKEMTQELKQHLMQSRNYISCLLYDLHLVNEDSYYFCEFDQDVFYHGKKYKHDMNIATATNTEINSSLTVDKMSITLYTDETDTLEGAKFMEIARNGGLDKASLTVHRAFIDENGETIGAIKLFTGILEVRSGGGITLKLDIKSKIQSLNIEFPNRRYYPTCPYSLYSTACGVDKEQYKVMGRVTRVISSNSIEVDVNKPSGYFDGGALIYMSGKMYGKDATIRQNSGKRITLLVSQEDVPSVGDAVKLYPGCDKSYSTCRNKYRNSGRNRSTPYVPLKEAVL